MVGIAVGAPLGYIWPVANVARKDGAKLGEDEVTACTMDAIRNRMTITWIKDCICSVVISAICDGLYISVTGEYKSTHHPKSVQPFVFSRWSVTVIVFLFRWSVFSSTIVVGVFSPIVFGVFSPIVVGVFSPIVFGGRSHRPLNIRQKSLVAFYVRWSGSVEPSY